MNNALSYLRISEQDQSRFSLTDQADENQDWADENGINIVETYVDNGQSAGSFNRKAWLKLEEHVLRDRSIRYIIVTAYDRLIRDLRRGLNMLERMERKLGVSIVSSTELGGFDVDDPAFYRYRVDLLLRAEDERRKIGYRAKRGMRKGKERGFYLGRASFGFENTRDKYDQPIIVPVKEKINIVGKVIDAWNQGVDESTIKRQMNKWGCTLKGNDRVKRMVSNPLYYGYVWVPPFGKKKGYLQEAKHEGVRPKGDYDRAMLRINTCTHQTKVILTEKAPLRQILKCCECHRTISGGESKGKRKKYWYYRCLYCKGQNFNVNKWEVKLYEMLQDISLPAHFFEKLVKLVDTKFDEVIDLKKNNLRNLKLNYGKIKSKKDALEEKYICDQITSNTYDRWFTQYTRELQDLELNIGSLETDIKGGKIELHKYANQFCNLGEAYNNFSLEYKRRLVSRVFNNNLYISKEGYRTPYIPLFYIPNNKKVRWLEMKNGKPNSVETVEFPVSTRSGT